ncbi:MAG: caspase family protein [Acidobacteriota bacterium]
MNKSVILRNSFAPCACIFIFIFLNLSFARAQEKISPADASKTEIIQPKFALLIGITKYKSDKINKIDGCENNVPLLRETLIKDFGFSENNVVTLLNDKATKEAIISNFRSHLIENAKKSKQQGKEAVIVYYFCGHGSQYPDQDDDENDGKDETFVAFDSRTGDVFDILDDELDDLKAELRPLTTNTTLILESCHSGTGSRGDQEYISEETDVDTRKRTAYKRKFPPSTDADSLTYTEISASLSTNTAKSESAEYCNCEKPLSLMTKALIQGLKRATNTTTYRGLTREISGEVAAVSRQEPQVEGNRDAVLFGGAAKRAQPFIEIEKILPANQIIIKAGTIHGLKEGSQISIYSSDSLTNSGKDGWLVNGIVSQIGNTASIVQIPNAEENPKAKAIKISSHVILASPIFGGGSVFLLLNSDNLKISDNGETALLKQIEDKLKFEGLFENQILKLAASDKLSTAEKKDAKGIIRLRKGKIKDIFLDFGEISPLLPKTSCEANILKTNSPESRFPAADAAVYYLDDGELGGTPLFGKTFDPADKYLAENIAETIKSYAYQRSLRGLDNAASGLSSQIKVSLQSIPGDAIIENCQNGEKIFQPDKEKFKGFQEIKDNKVLVDSYFQLKIKNISGEINKKNDEFASGEAFYISVIALTNTGEIKNVYASKGANDAVQDNKEITVYLRMTEPSGIERFVIVISKDNVDFSFYESKGTRRAAKSVLEQMLTQSGRQSRNSETVSDEPDKWDVIHLELNIVDKIHR